MRRENLKKQLIIESAVIGAGLALAGGVLWVLSAINDRMTESNRALKTEVNTLTSTTHALMEKYTKVKQNGPLYLEALEKKENRLLSITREAVRDRFNQFNSRYYLTNMRLVMGGIEELPDAKFKSNTGNVVASRVTVDADALSDVYIFNMANAMLQELPGSVGITHMNLLRTGAVTDDMLRTISQTGAFGIVKANVNFTWYGIKFSDTASESSPSTSDAHAPPPTP